jgi:hypothetical protein
MFQSHTCERGDPESAYVSHAVRAARSYLVTIILIIDVVTYLTKSMAVHVRIYVHECRPAGIPATLDASFDTIVEVPD